MKQPKEYARELVEKYSNGDLVGCSDMMAYASVDSVKCALIAVEEMLNFTINNCCEHQNRKYYEQIKTEINNLK